MQCIENAEIAEVVTIGAIKVIRAVCKPFQTPSKSAQTA